MRRYRLHRDGNRQANSALHMIVLCRVRTHPRTQVYVLRRPGEGPSKREVMLQTRGDALPAGARRGRKKGLYPHLTGNECGSRRWF